MYLLEVWFALGACPGVGFLDHMVALFFFFKEPPIVFFLVAVTIYILNNGIGWFPFLHTLMCFLAIYRLSLEKCLFRSPAYFLFFNIELHELFVYFGD